MTARRAIAQVNVDGARGYTQRIRAGIHAWSADEPKGRGGNDAGPAPYELLLSALGACTAITLRMYAGRKAWDLGRLNVSLRFFMRRDGEYIEREVHCSASLSDEQRAKLLEVCEKTPVTLTLKRGTPVTTRWAAQPETGAGDNE